MLEDSDDDGPTKKASPKKAAPKKRDPTPEGEATNASEYFGKAKPKKTAPVRSSTDKKVAEETPKNTPVKSTTKSSKNGTAASVTATPTGRTSSRRKAPVDYSEAPRTIKLDDEDEGDDVFEAEFKTKGKGLGDDYEEDDEEANDLDTKPRRVGRSTGRQSKILDDEDPFEETEDVDMKDVDAEDDFVVLDEDEAIEVDRPAKSKKEIASAAKKRKSHELDEDDEDSTVTPKKARGAKKGAPKKSPAKKKEKEADMPENAEMQAIFDSIPLVRPPTPPSQVDAKKFKFGGSHANTGPPPAADSKEIPVGADNCLAGLSFVFTGLLQVLQRDDAQNLVKRYGGKIVGAPSSKTSFVVLGSDAGPKKLETIAKFKIKTIDEDGLFELIKRLPANGGDSKAAAKNEEKKKAEMDKIKEQAAEIEKAERVSGGAGGAAVSQQNQNNTKPAGDGAADTRLWTVKYAPTSLAQICGNKQSVEKLQRWLRDFPKNAKRGFKLAGQDGSGVFRAVIISGPPGIGKTTAAHLVAKLEGYDIVESNASETRSKKLVEGGLKGTLDTTSLLGYFAGDGKKVETSKKKLCLIMDEVDGMSAGDRGGVGALAAVCKKTEVPMILICNERRLPKLKPFDYCTFALPFRRPTTDQIRSRIMTINYREGLKLPGPVLDALIEGTGADIRQVVNMVSTIKTDQNVNDEAVDFDKSKQMSKAWQKHVVLRPWDILGKILGGGLFTPTSKSTLNDKIELYFNDHEFSYLMLAENYLGTAPIRASQLSGREKTLKTLELVEQAANSISDGDLVDRLIHGPEQQWSLMPTHAVFSFVRPASYVAGTMAGHSSAFPAWLGKNSTQGNIFISDSRLRSNVGYRQEPKSNQGNPRTYAPSRFWRSSRNTTAVYSFALVKINQKARDRGQGGRA